MKKKKLQAPSSKLQTSSKSQPPKIPVDLLGAWHAELKSIARSLSCISRLKQTELEWLKGHVEFATKTDLHRLENKMAKTQAEVAQQLRDALAKLAKIETEQDSQAKLIKDLIDAAGAQPNATEELTTAADALSAELELSDAKVDDAV